MNKFRDLSIRTKLIIAFAIVLLTIVINSILGVQSLKNIQNQTDFIVNDRVVKVNKLHEWKEYVLNISELLRNILVVDDQKLIENYISHIKKLTAEVDEINNFMETAIKREEGKKILSEIMTYRKSYVSARENQFKLLLDGRKKEARDLLLGGVKEAEIKYLESLDKLIKYQQKQMEAAVEDGKKLYQRSLVIVFASLVFAILFVIFFVIILSKNISTPISKCLSINEKLADGDFTIDRDLENAMFSQDEAGRLLKSIRDMKGNLRNLVMDLKSASETLASASQQLSVSSEQMSRGIFEQSNRASQIATSATEMSQTVIDIAKNASQIAHTAGETTKTAKNGQDIVIKSVEEVKAIEKTVNESTELIRSLGERSTHIGEIVGVIKDIADQTNLLALNAAIEAARAGEQGRGFAVVADEVRKLADRTSNATSEISSMINAIQDEVQKVVVSMNECSSRVVTGVEYSKNAGTSLEEIVKSVDNLQSMVQQIASATEEMSSVSEQISNDIETIANVTKETSSGSEQVAQSASSLSKLANQINSIVNKFKV